MLLMPILKISAKSKCLFVLQVTDQELNFHLHQLSVSHMSEFDTTAALKELYIYVYKYYAEILEGLDDNFVCKKMGLQHKLKSIALAVNPGQLNV